MAEQTPMTIEGPINNIFLTEKVVKFQVNNEIFIGFEKSNKAVTLLRDYLQDLGQVTIKLECPMPLKRTLDKQTKVNQIVLTNHTKIYLENQLIFFPAEQSEDVALINDAIDYAIQQEKEQEINNTVKVIEQKVYPKVNQLQTANKQSSVATVDSKVIKKGGFYKVAGGKEVPDAPKIESEINKLVEDSGRVLNLIILEVGKDDEKAWARVRVEDALTKQFKDDAVIHHYNTLQDAFLLDLITAFEEQRRDKWTKKLLCPENPIEGLDSVTNKPILSSFAKRAIIIRLLKFKQFSERDAITKAASRAYLKMLNREWRTKEEIEDELREVELVNSQ